MAEGKRRGVRSSGRSSNGEGLLDRVTTTVRSRIMAAVKSRHTGPEMVVRRLAHRMGVRYSLHAKSLPGRPDLVFASRRKVIFVHGCFWHRHKCRQGKCLPGDNREFWQAKFDANKKRDANHIRELRKAGWTVLVVWSCETLPKRVPMLKRKLVRFLGVGATTKGTT
jgi:DNA mismatch endonuclease (patch repair protein)